MVQEITVPFQAANTRIVDALFVGVDHKMLIVISLCGNDAYTLWQCYVGDRPESIQFEKAKLKVSSLRAQG